MEWQSHSPAEKKLPDRESKRRVTGADPVLLGNQWALQRFEGESQATGIPAPLKARVEQRSGQALDQVRVYYQSDKPAKVGALAYTQGNQVYVGPGQEHHLPHELGHVVQQMEGRVRANGTVAGQPLNDDTSLEREADSYR